MKKSINTASKFIGIILVLMLTLLVANAAGGLNVVLGNQDPDPVSPGNFVYLNIKVSNIGSEQLKNVRLNLKENANFKLASEEKEEKEIGTLSAYSSSESSNSFVTVKYKVLVDTNTPLGLNTISTDVKTDTGTFNYDFEVLVQESNPLLVVKDISAQEVRPGQSTKLSIEIANMNSADMKDVKIALDLANVDDKVITVNKGSNEKIISSLKGQTSENVEFEIVASPDSSSKPYLLPVKISYQDVLEKSYETTVYAAVKVYSEPDISLTLATQEVYTKGRGKLSLAIANPGSSKVKGVQLEILDSDDYTIIEGEKQYIGDLNPDDFQTLQGDIYINNAEKASLKIKLTYSDSYDFKTEEVIDVPLKIYNSEELKSLGLAGTNSSGSGVGGYIFTLILLVVVFFVGKRFGYKKAKKTKK